MKRLVFLFRGAARLFLVGAACDSLSTVGVNSQFILGIRASRGLPYDGHTLKDQIAQVQRLTGMKLTRAYVDKGYRGHGLTVPDIHVTQGPGHRTPTIRRELRRCSAIEPVIGHTKSDGLLERNRLAGVRGDAVNAILVGAGHNIRLILAWLKAFLSFLRALIISNGSQPKDPGALAQHAVY